MNWIEKLLAGTKDSESPERYFYWSAIAALSAAIGKNLYLDRQYYKLYPNVFVILVSKASGLRKGLPVSIISEIVGEAQITRTIEGQVSIQGLIHEFSMQKTLENGLVLTKSQGLIISGEFDTLLVKDPDALTTLTALYNTHEHKNGWKKTLKSSPTEDLKDPCISMLAASNEVLFNDLVKGKDVEGGFIARSFIVYEEVRRRINPLVYLDPEGKLFKPEKLLNIKDLAAYLREIRTKTGEFKWCPKAARLYIKWYNDLCAIKHDDRTGSMDRIGDQVLKVAMILSIAQDLSCELRLHNLEEAIEKCEACMLGTRRVVLGSGVSETAPGIAKVLKVLLSATDNKIGRKKLLQRLWPDMDYLMLDRIIETLQQSGAIEILAERGVGAVYKMPKTIVDQYKDFKKEIN